MNIHRNLDVWRKGIEFVTTIYRITSNFTESEKYGLTSQMRRAAVSVPSNIAEGVARRTLKEGLQLFYVSRGSISELDTQIEICKELGLINQDEYRELCSKLEEISKMLNGLINYRKK